MINLGVNIDHIATLRNSRGENKPSLLRMLFEAEKGGADSITMHLREDRRHIQDNDIFEIKEHTQLPLNLEIALNEEMIKIALKLKPSSVCIVPERREEITTEGGLKLKAMINQLKRVQEQLKQSDIELYLFLEADESSISTAKEIGVTGVEIHTGSYARTFQNKINFQKTLNKLKSIAKLSEKEGLIFHAGHGLDYYNIKPLLDIINLKEVNIGHAIIAHSLEVGLKNAVQQMKKILNNQ